MPPLTPEQEAMAESIGGASAIADANNLKSVSYSGSDIHPDDQAAVDRINKRNQDMYDKQLNASYANYEWQQAQNQSALDRNAQIMSQPGVAEGNRAMIGMSWAPGLLPVEAPTFNMPKPPEFLQAKARYKSLSISKNDPEKDKAASSAKEKVRLLNLKNTSRKTVNMNENIFDNDTALPAVSMSNAISSVVSENIGMVVKDPGKFLSQNFKIHGIDTGRNRVVQTSEVIGASADLLRDTLFANPKLIAVNPTNPKDIIVKPFDEKMNYTEREARAVRIYHRLFGKDNKSQQPLLTFYEGQIGDGNYEYNLVLGEAFKKNSISDTTGTTLQGTSILDAEVDTKRNPTTGEPETPEIKYKFDPNANELHAALTELIDYSMGPDDNYYQSILNYANSGTENLPVSNEERKIAVSKVLALNGMQDFLPSNITDFEEYIIKTKISDYIPDSTGRLKKQNFIGKKTLGVIDRPMLTVLSDAKIIDGYQKVSNFPATKNLLLATEVMRGEALKQKGGKPADYISKLYDTYNSKINSDMQNILNNISSTNKSLISLSGFPRPYKKSK